MLNEQYIIREKFIAGFIKFSKVNAKTADKLFSHMQGCEYFSNKLKKSKRNCMNEELNRRKKSLVLEILVSNCKIRLFI